MSSPHRTLRHLRTLRRFLPAAAVALLALLALPMLPSSAEDPGAVPAHAGPGAPEDVERVVAGDMAVDWIGGAPEGAEAALTSSGVPVDLAVAPLEAHERTEGHDHHHDAERTDLHAAASLDSGDEVVERHAAASGGYALFSTTARWLPAGYTIRLSGGDRRIEQYRDHVVQAAGAVASLTGAPIRVAPAFGGPIDPSRGEIVVVLGAGPCGPSSVGCGGPALTYAELVHGRVWISPSALELDPARRTSLAAHELGHALGLHHYGGSWTDGRQIMYPALTDLVPFRAGDAAGLRRMAGADDQPAGAVTSRTYAAGWANVAGTVTSGTRVRISSGSIAHDVGVKGGRFHGAIPLRAGTHVICATSLDAAPGLRRDLGCGSLEAPGQPFGHVDRASGSFTSIRLSGWAIDPQTAGPVDVQVRRSGTLVSTVRADGRRDDLGQLARSYGTLHGFAVDIPAIAGLNRLCMRVVGVGGGGNSHVGCVEVVHHVHPTGVLEHVRADGLGIALSGWALDPNTPDPVLIEVRVDGEVPTVGGTARASQDRPDGAGRGFDHRVSTGPGLREVCVTVVNVGLGEDRSLGCTPVYVQDPTTTPLAVAATTVDHALDAVVDAATGPERFVGDLRATVLGR